MKRQLFLLTVLLLTCWQGAWADEWTNHTSGTFSSIDTSSKRITITNVGELALLAKNINSGESYQGWIISMDRDLDLSRHNWVPMGTSRFRFRGFFNGHGHTISGIVVDNAEGSGQGLFGYAEDAIITGLRVANSYIKGARMCGAIVGSQVNTGVADSRVAGDVTVECTDRYAGGLSGHALGSSSMSGCVSEARVTGRSIVGGLVGTASDMTIVNSIYLGSKLNADDKVSGAQIGVPSRCHQRNTFYTNASLTNAATNSMDVYAYRVYPNRDGLALQFVETGDYVPASYTTSGIKTRSDGLTVDGACYVTRGAKVTFKPSFEGDDVTNLLANGVELEADSVGRYTVANVSRATAVSCILASEAFLNYWGSLEGSERNPFTIRDEEGWKLLANRVAKGEPFAGKHFVLDADITVFTPVGSASCPFSGHFDGRSHTLTANLLQPTTEFLAPFIYASDATISHLKVRGQVSGGIHTAGLVGKTSGTNLIEDCWVSAKITFGRNNISDAHGGGFVGHGQYATNTLKGCVFVGQMVANGNTRNDVYAGAFMGWTKTPAILIDCLEQGQYTDCVYTGLAWHESGEPNATYANTYAVTDGIRGGTKPYAIGTSLAQARLEFGSPAAIYPTSGIASWYEDGYRGFGIGDRGHYAGEGEKVYFTISKPGYNLSAVTASAGTVSGNGNPYELTMPAADVDITATEAVNSLAGSGTQTDPFIVATTDDWGKLAADVAGGNSYRGYFFRMTRDVDAGPQSVGAEGKPFAGTFDGEGHILTFNRSTGTAAEHPDEGLAPFAALDGATILNLTTQGTIYSSSMYAAGIASQVTGTMPTTLYNCHSAADIIDGKGGNASIGGLVGLVQGDGATLEKCSFKGTLQGKDNTTGCGGLVGYAGSPLTLKDCVFAPAGNSLPASDCATLVRMATGKTATIADCYVTTFMGARQGSLLFDKVILPEGFTCAFLSEPAINIAGKSLWKSGTIISIQAGDGADTTGDHWTSPSGTYISDPWAILGRHQVKDVTATPAFAIEKSATVAPKDQKTINGVVYRYLSQADSKLYVSDEDRDARGWYFDGDGYLVMRDRGGDENYITAAVGYKSGDMETTLTGGWIWNSEYEGTVLTNDNVADLREHTHLGVIAPRAFKGCTDLQRLVFLSNSDTRLRKDCEHDLDLIVGEQAFEGCTNLKEFVMMYYDMRKSDKWVVLDTLSRITIADNAFDGTSARIMVDQTAYQGFLNNNAWRAHWNRFGIYNPTVEDFKVNGAVYSQFRSTTTGDLITNDATGRDAIMGVLRTWNANYQNLNAATLLAPADRTNIYYTRVIGADDSYLSSNDGVMRIYNDPGSYYNYKTIAIGANAFKGNKNLKAVEFWQTNGRSENSYSDAKLVIENGAFEGCDNLKELRLFYYAQDGDDHWEVLGPENVIPGERIFGGASADDLDAMTEKIDNGETVDTQNVLPNIPEGFKILVAPSRLNDFMEDPNWAPYTSYLEAEDFDPQNQKKDFTRDGVTYGYITNPGGILQTSQTVSQDVSWWTLPRIAYEIGMYVWTFGTWYYMQGSNEVLTLLGKSLDATNKVGIAEQAVTNAVQEKAFITAENVAAHQIQKNVPGQTLEELLVKSANKFQGQGLFKKYMQEKVFNKWVQWKWLTPNGDLALTAEQLAGTAEIADGLPVNGMQHGIMLQYWGILIKEGKRTAENIAAKKLAVEAAKKAAKIAARIHEQRLFMESAWGAIPYMGIATTTAGLISSSAWGGPGSYNNDGLIKGMRQNMLSNIHQVGSVGGGYVYTTPQKNVVYHTYVKSIAPDVTEAVILDGTDKGQGANANARTMTFAKNAFRGNKTISKISFRENNVSTNEALPMLITIPDSAFYGCDNLTELNLLLKSDHGTQALGPESFILGGDSVFVGLDSLKFHIRVDENRLQDFLASESWAPLKRFFVSGKAEPKSEYTEYGGEYAYAYENGSTQKVHKEQGHKVEHTVVIGPDNSFLNKHSGALKLCNDIGQYNNFQLDAVARSAFKGNESLRRVLFTDLYGTLMFGDVYTNLSVTLQDSCFAHCPNLQSIDLLYMVTDGNNHLDPIRPSQLKLGRGVLDGTTARIKMMPKQVAWFEADSTWAAYKDRFMPCVVQPADAAVKKMLKDLCYKDPAATISDDSEWSSHIDLSVVLDKGGFQWLSNKFTNNKDIRSFPDFKHFGSIGLDYVGTNWFKGCTRLTNILLPPNVREIHADAFNGATSLTDIDLPDSLKAVYDGAFHDCTALKTIRVHGTTPARLVGDGHFPRNAGMKIYVPEGTVEAYKAAWAPYRQYIVGANEEPCYKVVAVNAVGQLAEKLGLSLVKEHGKVRYIDGNYAKYDSLTVSGPLNGEDLSVLRHLAGADAYDSDPTDGQLRYLNLWNADIVKDKGNSYNGNGIDEYITADNLVPDYLFENCTAIQTVILPKSATAIGENIFEDASALRQVAVGYATKSYSTDILQNLEGIEELALLTDDFAYYDYSRFWGSALDPWEADIEQVYALPTQVGNYLGDYMLSRRAGSIIAPFDDNNVMKALADNGHYFANEYLAAEQVEGIFNGNAYINRFDDFNKFIQVRSLDNTFSGCTALRSISLPDSLKSISATAFADCISLDTIRVSCDSVPELSAHAFDDLAPSFRILVPKSLCKLYRERWAEYADHIFLDRDYYAADTVMVVRVSEPNTLAQALGLTTTTGGVVWGSSRCLTGVRGDFSHITKLKVVGPISGADFDLMRYMAGYCPWTQTRNVAGRLEYIDLYDANIVESKYCVNGEKSAFEGNEPELQSVSDNQLPYHAFLKAYSLKTLILPKTCKEVRRRALQECEALENLVIGDDCTDFNWNALDDDVMLSRLYILAKQKVPISQEFAIWRALCNNYSPTFDAFYVLPSTYKSYISDPNYVGYGQKQRTSLISTGSFADDEAFRAFASHAAATDDDLATVYNVDGWFDNFPGVTDLTKLSKTAVFDLKAKTLAPLAGLRAIALPPTIATIEDNAFAKATGLRYANFLLADSLFVTDDLRGGIERLGISKRALVYVPKEYGETDEHNVIWGSDTTTLYNNYLDIYDDDDYLVPYAFQTKHIANSRTLIGKQRKYTAVLPYSLNVPAGMKAYRLKGREGSTLTFHQAVSPLEAFVPYIFVLDDESAHLGTDIAQEIPNTHEAVKKMGEQQVDVLGFSLRGTLGTIDNKTAHELGAWIMQPDNKWWPVPANEAKAYIPPFRCYLLENGSQGVNALDTEFTDETDGIDTIRTVDSDGTERYYDLNGRELPGKPQRGIYIHNGKKYAVK